MYKEPTDFEKDIINLAKQVYDYESDSKKFNKLVNGTVILPQYYDNAILQFYADTVKIQKYISKMKMTNLSVKFGFRLEETRVVPVLVDVDNLQNQFGRVFNCSTINNGRIGLACSLIEKFCAPSSINKLNMSIDIRGVDMSYSEIKAYGYILTYIQDKRPQLIYDDNNIQQIAKLVDAFKGNPVEGEHIFYLQ